MANLKFERREVQQLLVAAITMGSSLTLRHLCDKYEIKFTDEDAVELADYVTKHYAELNANNKHID